MTKYSNNCVTLIYGSGRYGMAYIRDKYYIGQEWLNSAVYHRHGKFTGLNFHCFNPTEVFVEYFCSYLARSAYYLREVLIT